MKRAIFHGVWITALFVLTLGRASAARFCLQLEYPPSRPPTILVIEDSQKAFLQKKVTFKFLGEHICTEPNRGMLASSPAEGTGHLNQQGKLHIGVITHGGPSGHDQDSCPVSSIELMLTPDKRGGLSDGSGTIFLHPGGEFDNVTTVHLVTCPSIPR